MRGRFVVAAVALLGLCPVSASGLGVSRFHDAGDAVTIAHPRHRAELTTDGVVFVPVAGPRWSWRLRTISSGGQEVDLDRCAVPALREDEHLVEYDRGAAIEQYVGRNRSIEQQFVIPQRLGAGDLVIEGAIVAAGRFRRTGSGWMWTDEKGSVSLGRVTVFDANGCPVEASMDAGPDWTRITVAGNALQNAVYPITIDPEIGANDFRISSMGTDGDDDADAYLPAVAYNSTNDEYLVVWQGSDDAGEMEIWAQRVDGDGTILGAEFRVSTMGTAAGTSFTANAPDVAYNATSNEYLVVWRGDDDTAPNNFDNDNEIFGQRINAATGAEIAPDDFRISQMGPNDAAADNYGADSPSVAWNSTNNQYLVVWQGSDQVGGLIEGESEIWGRLVSATGTIVSGSDIRISETTPDASFLRSAVNAAVAYDSTNNRYLVVWTSDDDLVADNHTEVFGQLLTNTGADFGSDFRISNMGLNTDVYGANSPAVAFNPAAGEYLVVWDGDHTSPGDNEFEIFGQLIAASGAELGSDFQISEMGPVPSTALGAAAASVAYDPVSQQFLVVWTGADVVQGDAEVWGQRISSAGAAVGRSDYRISEVAGPAPDYQAGNADVATGGTSQMLVLWRATSQTLMIPTEQEVFGQRFDMDNDAPSPGYCCGGTIDYTEGSPAMIIVDQAALGDDSEDFETGNLTVSLTANGGAADRLGIRNQGSGAGQIGVSGSNVQYGGITIGTYTGGIGLTPLVVTFGDQAIVQAVQALMRNITYHNVAASPSGAPRTVQFSVNDGDGQFGVVTRTINFILVVDAPTGFVATATSTSQVALSWNPVAGATGYEIYRSVLNSAFTLLTTVTNPSHNDTSLSANTSYLYKVRTVEGTATSPFTAVDVATTILFTDPVITAGVTTIKAVHINELRTAVNAMRAAMGSGAALYTDPVLAAGNSIRTLHITDLRIYLDAARTALGLTAVVYTDPSLTAGVTPVRRLHIVDLRSGTQ